MLCLYEQFSQCASSLSKHPAGPAVDAPDLRISLFANTTNPCYSDTVDLICRYPGVIDQDRYSVNTPSWRMNETPLYHDGDVFNLTTINQTASRFRVRIDPATFTGDPVIFTCYLHLNGGEEESNITVVDPQGVCVWFILLVNVPFSLLYNNRVFNFRNQYMFITAHTDNGQSTQQHMQLRLICTHQWLLYVLLTVLHCVAQCRVPSCQLQNLYSIYVHAILLLTI